MASAEIGAPVVSPPLPRRDRKAWGVVVLLFAFFTLNFADKAAVGLASQQIRHDLGLSAADFGLVGSAFFWLFAVGAVGLSAAMRWISAKWAAAILMFTWVASMLPLAVPTTFGVLLVSRIVLGFFEGPAHALCQSVVADRFPKEKRAFAGSIVNAGSSVGPLISAPALTWVIVSHSWHAAFLVLIAVGIVWLVVWLCYVERQPLRKRPSAEDAEADPNGRIDVPFLRLLRLPSFWGLSLMSFAGYLITSLKVAWLPAFLGEGLGYSPTTVGWLVTLPYATAIVVLIASGYLSGRLLARGWSSRAARGYFSGALIIFAGLSMIAFTLVGPGKLQLALVICTFSINSVAFSVAFAGASDFLPQRQRAAFFGCVIGFYSLAGIIAPYALGLIVQAGPTASAGYANGFLVVGIAICACAAVGARLLNPEAARQALEAETAMRRAS
ncbi:MFS transporter [Saccharopolyspora sp. TS4A08]|uniref:MFS transporter n=1 Tax=Saccharopolyspora ipomoeae TaxID=3042027 RepID=A0ABT6PJP3_9PSEU|nr:MFS transporter [Saccharopolyspora sp. TS4A08]MDI2028220.1 MFS transporter [Saccharopolyspora sp. TS4A08]